MTILKSILAGLAFDVVALAVLLGIFLLLVRRSGMFGIGPLRVVVIWVALYLLAAFISGFVWMYQRR